MSFFYIPNLVVDVGQPVLMPTQNGIQWVIGINNSSYKPIYCPEIYEHRTATTTSQQDLAIRKMLEFSAEKQKGETFRQAVNRTFKEDPYTFYPMTKSEVMGLYKKKSSGCHYKKNSY